MSRPRQQFNLYPWISNWRQITKVIGLSRSRIEKLTRYFEFPLRFLPNNHATIHSKELLEWVLPKDGQSTQMVEIKNKMGILSSHNALLELERMLLSGWENIANYLGYVHPSTAKRFAEEYGLPAFRKAGKVRSLPQLVDRWVIEWDRHMKELRRDFYRK